MASTVASSLTSLPEDLLFFLMTKLDGPSIRSMALTCQTLYQIFQSPAIQYTYELYLNSMEDVGSGLPPAELLKALRDRETAWRELNWKSVEIVKAGPTGLAAYGYIAGVFAQTDGFDFSVFWLPSTTRKGTCVTTPIDFRIHDFIIDVPQDLVIFLHEELLPSGSGRGNLYCRTISTNQPHPACSASRTLSFEVPQHPQHGNITSVELELAVDILFLSIRQGQGIRLLIWNWTMGLLIYDSFNQLSPFINDFDIVRRDVFILISCADSGKILIHQFSPTMVCTPVLIATLSLPEIMSTPRMIWFRAHSGQFQERPTPGTLFMPSPIARTHVFSAAYSSTVGVGRYALFVQSSTFLRYVDRGEEGQEVSWKEWGEEDCRFMAKRIGENWLRFAHGSRIVCNSIDKVGVDVFNFSSSRCNADSSASGSRERQYFSRDNPTVISKDVKIFEEDVVTRLPYHVASREMEETPFAYMIDEERIIGLKFGTDAVELTVYSF